MECLRQFGLPRTTELLWANVRVGRPRKREQAATRRVVEVEGLYRYLAICGATMQLQSSQYTCVQRQLLTG